MANGHDNVFDMPLQELPAEPTCVDAPSFETFLHEQYRGLIQFLRRRTATEQDAEDAAQDSLARLLRYRESQPPSSWKPLLYRIASNVALDQFRVATTHRDRAHVSLEQQDLETQTSTPEEAAVREQQLARLTAAILSLPPKCQQVYLLKRVHGLRRGEIARRCGISVKMVEKHLARALVLLRSRVGDPGEDTFQ